MQEYKLLKVRSIMEAVNWVCDDALDDHEWVSELTISCEEAKVLEAQQYDLANRCIVQWRMLWFSAPTCLNNRLLKHGVILEKYNEAFGHFGHLRSTFLEDGYSKILLLEIDTYCID